jgi:hypothetical protein
MLRRSNYEAQSELRRTGLHGWLLGTAVRRSPTYR